MNPIYRLPRDHETRAKAWKEIIESYKQSGLTFEAFCQQAEVRPETLLKWKKIFSEGKTGSFVPIEITTPTEEYYEIKHRNGFSLIYTGRGDTGTLTKLLRAIGGAI